MLILIRWRREKKRGKYFLKLEFLRYEGFFFRGKIVYLRYGFIIFKILRLGMKRNVFF